MLSVYSPMKRCPECRRDYYDDSLAYCLDDGAALVEGPGSTESPTAILESEDTTKAYVSDKGYTGKKARPSWILYALGVASVVAVAVTAGWLLRNRGSDRAEIRSIAILPLKSLHTDDNHLGLGIADAVIRKLSQTGQLTVRPTNAVRKYLNIDTDALTFAKELGVDAVLDGTVDREDERLRVSVNLLRTRDAVSLWADSFDMRMADIFTIQDAVSQQVASRLSLQIDRAQQLQMAKRYTSSPVAWELYVKGIYGLDQRMTWQDQGDQSTIDSFKRAIDADPGFALAHAQLAYTYAARAVFTDPTESLWADRAKEEIQKADEIDPQLAETHLARFQLLFSQYGGYDAEAAIRELLSAQKINPNIGHGELAYLYIHLGLEDLAARELHRGADIDPSSSFIKGQTLNMYEQGVKYDEWFAYYEKSGIHDPLGEAWYYIGKGRLDDAQRALDEGSQTTYDNREIPKLRALLLASRGDFRGAEALIPVILAKHPTKDPFYHHDTYDIARIYALEGNVPEAMRWLRETAENGFPCFTLFQRDADLDHIRQSGEFNQFVEEMRKRSDSARLAIEQVK